MNCKYCGKATENGQELCSTCIQDKKKLDEMVNTKNSSKISEFILQKSNEYNKLSIEINNIKISPMLYIYKTILIIFQIFGTLIFVALASLYFILNFQIIADILKSLGFNPKIISYEDGRSLEIFLNVFKFLIIITAFIISFITVLLGQVHKELKTKIKLSKLIISLNNITKEVLNDKKAND
jgi:hypothetical protein